MYSKKESGQILIIVAGALVALMVFAALAIDLGGAYDAKRQAQNAADAGAMAAARQIILECNKGAGADENAIRSNALQMVAANAPDSNAQVYYINSEGNRLFANEVGSVGYVSCECGANRAEGVEIIVDGSTDSFIAGVIGEEALGVRSTAKAKYQTVSTPSGGIGLYPVTRRVGVPIVTGEAVEIRNVQGGEDIPGNFGWLTWNGSTAAGVLEQSMTPPGNSYNYTNPYDPNDHEINIGDWVEGTTGNMANLKKTLDIEWVNTGEIMIFPLYDAFEGTGSNGNWRVAGFAAVEITGYDLGGSDKHIDARFVDAVIPGNWAEATCTEETGLYSVKLIPSN